MLLLIMETKKKTQMTKKDLKILKEMIRVLTDRRDEQRAFYHKWRITSADTNVLDDQIRMLERILEKESAEI
jgi:hypothetical protein